MLFAKYLCRGIRHYISSISHINDVQMILVFLKVLLLHIDHTFCLHNVIFQQSKELGTLTHDLVTTFHWHTLIVDHASSTEEIVHFVHYKIRHMSKWIHGHKRTT